MDGKTPVTLLHEYLIKGGELPDYKLVYNGVGTHDPLFQYEVTAKGKIAVGKGKSKKEAKHDAARLLLLQLKEDKTLEDEVNVISPYAHALKENAVGALQDFCTMHNAVSPKYDLIRDEGLAHAKIFGIRCKVSSFTTEAEARTKKQAKQQASHLMLLKLQKCLNDENFTISSEVSKEEVELTADACKITMEAFDKVQQERLINDKDRISCCKLGTSMSNFADQFLENVLPLSETLRSIAGYENMFFENHENPEELLDKIMSQLDYNYNFGNLESASPSYFLCCLQINDLNYANFIGLSTDKNSARRNAILKALQFLATMSKT